MKTTEIRLAANQQATSRQLDQCIAGRRSIRSFRSHPVELSQVSRILWSAQGITGPEGERAAPSAGALYPIEICVIAGDVTGLQPGEYRFLPVGHSLLGVREGDIREELAAAFPGQQAVREATLTLCLTAVEERTTRKYGARGRRYIELEAGHISQNICLQAVSLDLGSVVIGAFDDRRLSATLQLHDGEKPLYAISIGVPRKG